MLRVTVTIGPFVAPRVTPYIAELTRNKQQQDGDVRGESPRLQRCSAGVVHADGSDTGEAEARVRVCRTTELPHISNYGQHPAS